MGDCTTLRLWGYDVGMSFLGNLLATAASSPGHLRAKRLAKNDSKYIRDLIEARRSAGLSQEDVAERMGVSQQSISKFERYENDPRLSTLRRYAHAVEAEVEHIVIPESAQVVEWQTFPSARFIQQTDQSLPGRYVTAKRTDFALAG